MIGPEAMQVDGGAPAPVQRLRPFNHRAVTVHELDVILWVLSKLGRDRDEISRLINHDLGLKVLPVRVSADDPRTGDMIELGDNRVVYVNERIEINDPMTWKAICQCSHPDAVYTLAGGR